MENFTPSSGTLAGGLIGLPEALELSRLGYSVLRVRERPPIEARFRLPNKYDLDTRRRDFRRRMGACGFPPRPRDLCAGNGHMDRLRLRGGYVGGFVVATAELAR